MFEWICLGFDFIEQRNQCTRSTPLELELSSGDEYSSMRYSANSKIMQQKSDDSHVKFD